MNISELMCKNDTALIVCHDLANRKRNREEPLRLSRYARRIRQKVEAMGFNTFSAKDFREALKELEKLGWGKLIANERGTITHFKFKRDILQFAKEVPDRELAPVLPIKSSFIIPTSPPDVNTIYKLVYILPQGRVTLHVETKDLKGATVGLIEELKTSLKDV